LKLKVEVTGWSGEKLLKEGLWNKACEIIDLPEGRKPLECKWVFTVRKNKNLYDLKVTGGMKNWGGVL
jgi:hypothetical protein